MKTKKAIKIEQKCDSTSQVINFNFIYNTASQEQVTNWKTIC